VGLALIAQIFEGFSLDTFALPQLWIILGIFSAVTMMEGGTGRNSEVRE
jgi:hypothetical protein